MFPPRRLFLRKRKASWLSLGVGAFTVGMVPTTYNLQYSLQEQALQDGITFTLYLYVGISIYGRQRW